MQNMMELLSGSGVRAVINRQGQMVVMSRKARLLIVAQDGRELQQHALEYGSIVYVKDKQEVKVGTKLADWDANNKVLMTEKAGTVVYLDLIENVTIQERFDEATGKSRTIVMGTRGEKYQPAISIVDDRGEELAQYFLPAGSYVNVTEKQRVEIGDVLVKMPREVAKSKDITTVVCHVLQNYLKRVFQKIQQLFLILMVKLLLVDYIVACEK